MLEFSNPQTTAEFPDWPLGGTKRGLCRFWVEFNPGKGKGYRVGKVTINPKTGQLNKPKYDTYGGPAAIVDGNDGRTYILQYTNYDFIKVSTHDFMSAGSDASYFRDNPLFGAVMNLISQAGPRHESIV